MSGKAGSSLARFPWHDWPTFFLKWVNRKSKPADKQMRVPSEHISGMALIQANLEWRKQGLLPFVYGAILNALHLSPTDPKVHTTIATAKEEMRANGCYVDIHGRADQDGMDKDNNKRWTYAGVMVSKHLKKMSAEIRNSYDHDKHRVRSFLAAENGDEEVPVGCIVEEDGTHHWYIVADDGESVTLENDNFVRMGEGNKEHLEF